MILLSTEQCKKSYGERVLFEDVSFRVDDRDAIGFVGANGVGKTTLFRILTGQERVDSGLISKSKQLTIGYMEQHVCTDNTLTAYEQVLSQFSALLQMEESLEQLAVELEQHGGDPQLIERQHQLQERFQRDGGLTFRSRSRAAMLGLGLKEEELDLHVSALSGGQRSKLSLARLLVSGANLLLLDEPTNHLDIAAVEWLEEYLKTYQGAFLVISHDRYFLDKVTTSTMELEHNKITVFSGNYSAYLQFKREQREVQQKHFEQTSREIKRLEGIVAQQRQWNREKNIKTAESKLKVIEKLEATLEKPAEDADTIRFTFHAKESGANDVMTASELSLAFDQHLLFKGVDISVYKGERVFLLGPNGCGKTSLFRLIAGRYEGGGSVRFGSGIVPGFYDQTQSDLHPEKTVLGEVWDQYPKMTQTELRNALAAFLFRGDDVYQPIASLSGGERARVALVKLMLSGANLLFLDEPTNHLDIGSREALEAALSQYNGALFVISHDRYFINKLASRVYYMHSGGASEYRGNYDQCLEQMALQPKMPSKEKDSSRKEDYKARKQRESAFRKLVSKIERLEKELDDNELEQKRIGGELTSEEVLADYQKLLELTQKLEQLKTREHAITAEWEETMLQKEEMESQMV